MIEINLHPHYIQNSIYIYKNKYKLGYNLLLRTLTLNYGNNDNLFLPR